MKLIKNIFIKLIWLILIILVAFNIYNFISVNVLKKDIASINGYAILEVVSGSMEPTIKVGDIIVIKTKESNYKVGDIITFYDINGSFVTHRLVKIGKDKMITKGDANDSEDEEMETKNIVGKYVTKISGAGKIMSSLKNPLVMLLIMVIGIVLCLLVSTDENLLPKDLTDEEKAYLEYKKLYKEKRTKKEKEEKSLDEKIDNKIEEAEVIGEIIFVSSEELEKQEEISDKIRSQLKEELRKEIKEELRREIQQENKFKKSNKKKNYNNNNKKHIKTYDNQNSAGNNRQRVNKKNRKHQHKKKKQI